MKQLFGIFAAAFMCLLLSLPAVWAADTILAERVETAQIRDGDRIVIVSDAAQNAISATLSGTRIAPADVSLARTATRRVLTDIGADAAVFTVSVQENGIFLRCEAGYLTSSATVQMSAQALSKEKGVPSLRLGTWMVENP